MIKHVFALFLGVLMLSIPSCPETSDCTPEILVGPRRSLTITVPCIDHADLVQVAATFFSKNKPRTKSSFVEQLTKSDDITLTLTSKQEK